MPISQEELRAARNSFIAVTGHATARQALALLQAQRGELWWHLVVRTDDGAWGVAAFSELLELLTGLPADGDQRLGGWPGLRAAPAVEQASAGSKAAATLARKSPGRVVVVTDAAGLPQGILFEGSRGASRGALPSGKLSELCGPYVALADYGSILLSSSHR